MSGENKDEMVTISKSEYKSLQRDSEHLNVLEIRGVDNWVGYVGPSNYCDNCGYEATWFDDNCPDCGEKLDDGY